MRAMRSSCAPPSRRWATGNRFADEERDRIVVCQQYRRDHPAGTGTIDHPGITVLHYAGGYLVRPEGREPEPVSDVEREIVPMHQLQLIEYRSRNAAAPPQGVVDHRIYGFEKEARDDA